MLIIRGVSKTGKKKIKNVSNALAKVHRVSRTSDVDGWVKSRQATPAQQVVNSNLLPPPGAPITGHEDPHHGAHDQSGMSTTIGNQTDSNRRSNPARALGARSPLLVQTRAKASSARQIESGQDSVAPRTGVNAGYGSISPSPAISRSDTAPPSLRLPGPALSDTQPEHGNGSAAALGGAYPASSGAAGDIGRQNLHGGTLPPLSRRNKEPKRLPPTPKSWLARRPTLWARILPHGSPQTSEIRDVPLEHYRQVDLRKAEFFDFLDRQLRKIEEFYLSKETEATHRLRILEGQLCEMKERRVAQVTAAEQARTQAERQDHEISAGVLHTNGFVGSTNGRSSKLRNYPFRMVDRLRDGRFGDNTRAWKKLSSPERRQSPVPNVSDADGRRDFARRASRDNVPYRVAKRKLKLALQEFYRGLELLKSYALLNRTAFRKINKKYDKAVTAQQSGQYLTEKLNSAHFVNSELLDNFLVTVENLYAQYFEKGNHKVAVNKLRSKPGLSDFSGTVFRNGLLLAAGLVLGIEAVVKSGYLLTHTTGISQSQVSFLLQLYAGYFLALFLTLLFCLDARIWSLAKINYVFVFEFDTRHNLDWRQLAEIPCLLLFLEGLFIWLNFQVSSSHPTFLYWPVGLVGLSAVILCFPGKALYHRSRLWWAYSNFRLMLAGFYPVEFRDFFLGDMYCSLTYAMGNIEVFFCLYARGWSDMNQCNSSHSRVLGFLSCLPGIWRALQCVRRYHDTKHIFPHLVNCGKYACTIMFYMMLSIYRINGSGHLWALFVTFATINSVYCCKWRATGCLFHR